MAPASQGRAVQAVEGKPFSISEFNQVFPNQFGAEDLPLMEIAANLQDWDTLYFYGYAAGYETSGYDGVFGELTWNLSGEGIIVTAVRAHR